MEPPELITFEQIRERAYDLWERNHRPDGFEMEFWLMAERELKAERGRSLASANDGRTPSADHDDPGQEPGPA
ncbi:DUF2934 domain-containing protein [Methylobacterium sp. R2-1]|uniref:DUF2934 domain-containing protein n=1 Tax=Methylobacterium sp. R2-1 TaxID=2587064 RepID=UPI001611491C|nr:DUF2934 domain-containing protein [Methylobacterium sp. R2-1]MBB2964485.1 hypothetical protein [Methylobacterium sp. R2-1]